MIKFIADSSSDLSKSEDFTPVPLTISTNERTFVDDEKLDIKEMLDYLENYKGRSFTACPSSQSWLDSFEDGDEIYVATMTSILSGTYNSARLAKDIYLESHPDAKILLFDTLSTGGQLKMVIEKMMEWKKEGKSFAEISEKIKDYNDNIRLLFAFRSLNNFANNGRVSKLVATAVGTLGISIFGTAKDGNIAPLSKLKGEKKVLSAFINDLEENGFEHGKVSMSHVENEDLCLKLKKKILERFPQAVIDIYKAKGLCSYYAERKGIIVCYEKH